MWYQRVSARSMPPARLPSVGTIQAAATAAQAAAASQIATRAAGGAGGVGAGPGPRRASRRPQTSRLTPASATQATIIVTSP